MRSWVRNNTYEQLGTMFRKEQKHLAHKGTRTGWLSTEPQCRFCTLQDEQNDISPKCVRKSILYSSPRCIFWWGNRIRRQKMGTWQHFVQDDVFSMFFLSPENFIEKTFYILHWFVIYSSGRIFWTIICDTFDHADDFDLSDATRPQRVWRNIETL